MRRSSALCLDANLVIRYLQDEPTPSVRQLWQEWLGEGRQLHAPSLIYYEVASGLHRLERAGKMTTLAATKALVMACEIPIEVHRDEALHVHASRLARDHRLPATCDAHYLALAERLGIELWTADAKLAGAVSERMPWVRLVA